MSSIMRCEMPEKIRIFFSTDAHGSERVWAKWLAVPKHHKVDVLILSGDLTGKVIVPIIKRSSDLYTCKVFGQRWTASNKSELEALKEKILFSGYYPFVSTPQEVEELKRDQKKVDELFERIMEENIARWMKLVEEKVSKDVKVIVMPGNDDCFAIDKPIKECKRVIYPLGRAVPFVFDYEMISLDYVNPTPWDSPRECSEEELWKKLEKLADMVTVPWDKVICNIHCPPFATKLDLAPELDKNLKVKIDASGQKVTHVGSQSVFKFIQERQPYLGLHGHIHESPGFENIGKTLCFNAGSEYGEGILKGAIFIFTKDGLDTWYPISG